MTTCDFVVDAVVVEYTFGTKSSAISVRFTGGRRVASGGIEEDVVSVTRSKDPVTVTVLVSVVVDTGVTIIGMVALVVVIVNSVLVVREANVFCSDDSLMGVTRSLLV